jgi:hypothetical protein
MNRQGNAVTLAAAFLVISGCGQGEQLKAAKEAVDKTTQAVKQIDTKKLDEAARKMEDAQKSGDTQAAADAMKAITGAISSASGEAVDFRELRALLPEALPGMKRVTIEGQKGGAMGVNVATAKAEYLGEGPAKNQSIRLEISDIAGMGAMASFALAWANVDIDKETQDGYEKTTTVNGRRSIEKFSKASGQGEVTTLVANRFVVTAQGSNVDLAAFKAAVAAIDLNKLEKLKPPAPAVADTKK